MNAALARSVKYHQIGTVVQPNKSLHSQCNRPKQSNIEWSFVVLEVTTLEDRRERQLKKEALEYHEAQPHGKIKVVPTKPHSTAHELSLAYSPGVAYPCLEIAERPELAYKYTSKANLVAVISNGTAVLGLGNIGPLASKPVMEGKGLLLKTFADIDVFDIEVDTEDSESFIQTVVNI